MVERTIEQTHCKRCGAQFRSRTGSRTCPRCVLAAVLQNQEQDLQHDLRHLPPGTDPLAYIQAACGDDAALAERLRIWLANGPLDLFSGPLPEPSRTIGRYKLLEKIGEGGFGEVWMADQREPVRRRVALKIIKLGMDTRQVVARFEAERQALALMDHPNIAKVFDAGATETGRPYFVMELVRGARITEYCDKNALAAEERLNLFVQVCQAIQHAHQKGIIHRDIKPSNILVTLHDGVPVPKVIDFGIAKATQGELTDKTLFTQFQQFIGTPAYISPEQAETSGLDIDTRSDIYSLGVLLYELLVGRTPFDAQEMTQGGIDALRQIIREKEPVKPSTRLRTLPAIEQTTTAQQRHSDPVKLTHLLRGDLDWIVMKCLEKDRARRYETANGLAMDLQRYLANEPVVARPPSTAYRLQKTWKRNKLAFTAAALVALALLGLMISIVTFSILFGREQERTAATLRSSLAGEYLRRGQGLCLVGKVVEGLHWMVRSLEQASADETNLITVIRANLGGWSAARNRPVTVIYQKALIYAAAFSPTDDRLVLGGMSGQAQMYSATTGEPIGVPMPHGVGLAQTVFSPDGRFLATMDGQARLWFATDGRPAISPLGDSQRVRSVAFSPDSQRLLVAGDDGSAGQWSVETGQRVGALIKQPEAVLCAEFSPDGRWIVTGCSNKTARLWSAENGSPASAPLPHPDIVNRLMFSPDGAMLATLCRDRTIHLWSVNELLKGGDANSAVLIRHDGVVSAIAFSPDSQRLMSGSEDGTARLWDLHGEPIGAVMRHTGGVLAAAFTPDGRRVCTGGRDRAARFWLASTGEPLGLPLEHDSWVAEIHFSHNGSKVLTRTYGHSGAVWAANLTSPHDLELNEQPVLAGVFSPDGKHVLTANILGEARVWSAENGTPSGIVVQHRLWDVAYSPDGAVFLTAGRDGLVKFWSAASGAPVGSPLVHSNEIRSAVFSHDGKQVATACFDKTARIWSLERGLLAVGPLQHPAIVEEVNLSPDDSRLVTACGDGNAYVWSVATGQLVFPPLAHRSAVLTAVFSPDGRRILTGSRDSTARLWDAVTGQPVGSPMQHPDWVEEAVFSPDGRTILTGCNDGTAWLWSSATGQLLGPPVLNHGPLMDVSFSPDGQRAITSSQAKAFWVPQGPTFRGAKIWRVPAPFVGPRETASHWVESLTGMTLDERGALSWLEPAEWVARKQKFE